jgi:hypothetical protein
MMGAGERWMAENDIHLDGRRVKNQALVHEITVRLRTLNVEFRW